MKSMIMAAKSMTAMDKASHHSVVPSANAEAFCLMTETFRERRIIVAPRRKLVMMVALKLALSTSTLGCSNDSTFRVGILLS